MKKVEVLALLPIVVFAICVEWCALQISFCMYKYRNSNSIMDYAHYMKWSMDDHKELFIEMLKEF